MDSDEFNARTGARTGGRERLTTACGRPRAQDLGLGVVDLKSEGAVRAAAKAAGVEAAAAEEEAEVKAETLVVPGGGAAARGASSGAKRAKIIEEL